MERKTNEPTFVDGAIDDLGDPKTMAFLGRVARIVPWELLAALIRPVYRNNTQKGGRPNVPVIMMLKVIFLQKWFNLSDPQAEAMLRDRISFRKFVGLGYSDDVIDETTIVKFRERLREHQLIGKVFDTAREHLEAQGLIVNEGTIVDATIIQAPRGRTKDDGTSTRDPAATHTRKHGRAYHGYKGHIATDVNGMAKDYVFDTAKVHDSKHMDQLIEGESKAVYGDSAYMDGKRRERLEKDGIFWGICYRRVRGQEKLTHAQREHNRRCSRVRAMVETPFARLKGHGGFRVVRYRGLARNAIDFALGLMTGNFVRALSLQG